MRWRSCPSVAGALNRSPRQRMADHAAALLPAPTSLGVDVLLFWLGFGRAQAAFKQGMATALASSLSRALHIGRTLFASFGREGL